MSLYSIMNISIPPSRLQLHQPLGRPQTSPWSGGKEIAARSGHLPRLPCWRSCSQEGHSVWLTCCQGDRDSRRTGLRHLQQTKITITYSCSHQFTVARLIDDKEHISMHHLRMYMCACFAPHFICTVNKQAYRSHDNFNFDRIVIQGQQAV